VKDYCGEYTWEDILWKMSSKPIKFLPNLNIKNLITAKKNY
jgi:hypothetical protein